MDSGRGQNLELHVALFVKEMVKTYSARRYEREISFESRFTFNFFADVFQFPTETSVIF